MKTTLKRIQIISLVSFIGFGFNYSINEVSVQHAANNHYVLSRYSPNRNMIRLPQSQKSQGNTTTLSLPANTQKSSNWGGYIVTPNSDSGYTSASGSWIIPNISASQRNAVAAQWIGLGGVSSSDLLQMGTLEQVENGQPVAEVFWEQLPAPAQYVMTVPIGSTINVNISKASSSTWDLTYTVNSSTNQQQSKTISATLDSSYAQGIGTSAEWISEDPSTENGQLVPLANTGTVKYQSAVVNGQPLNSSSNNVQAVAMVSGNKSIMIAPSALGTDGESFTTTSTNSAPSRGGNSVEKPFRGRIKRLFGWNR